MPFVSVGGRFVAYKAGGVKEEMNYAQPAIKLLSGRIEEPISFQLPGTEIDRDIERHLNYMVPILAMCTQA